MGGAFPIAEWLIEQGYVKPARGSAGIAPDRRGGHRRLEGEAKGWPLPRCARVAP